MSEYALRWLLYAVHQDILDILSMVMVRAGLRKPPTYSGIADSLYEDKLISESTRNVIKRLARNRNSLAHAYREFTIDELIQLRDWVLKEAPSLLNTIAEIINKLNIDPSTPSKLEALAKVFREHGILMALLFGSRARGDYKDDSDYDIAILGREPLTYEELTVLAEEIANAINVPLEKVDLIDLRRASNELAYAIIRDGIIIYTDDHEKAVKWLSWRYALLLDEEENLKDTYYRALEEELRRLVSKT